MSEWVDGMNEHDQLRALVVENQRLRAEVERLRDLLAHNGIGEPE